MRHAPVLGKLAQALGGMGSGEFIPMRASDLAVAGSDQVVAGVDGEGVTEKYHWRPRWDSNPRSSA